MTDFQLGFVFGAGFCTLLLLVVAALIVVRGR